ncbi:hypothetical protein AAG570_001972 [Ranatra chinensis]|uniref:Uncharacterized protein n=1 Tax=Ranatra chinensis TaxID=642074 RepID=A0ABD0YAB8_9HEMI
MPNSNWATNVGIGTPLKSNKKKVEDVLPPPEDSATLLVKTSSAVFMTTVKVRQVTLRPPTKSPGKGVASSHVNHRPVSSSAARPPTGPVSFRVHLDMTSAQMQVQQTNNGAANNVDIPNSNQSLGRIHVVSQQPILKQYWQRQSEVSALKLWSAVPFGTLYYRPSLYYSGDVNYDPGSTAEDGDWPKPVCQNAVASPYWIRM